MRNAFEHTNIHIYTKSGVKNPQKIQQIIIGRAKKKEIEVNRKKTIAIK